MEKLKNIGKRIGVFLIAIAIYLLVPQLVGSVFYYRVGLPETVSVYIGNIVAAVVFIVMYYKMFKEKIKEYFKNFKSNLKLSLKYWGIGLLIMYIANFILSYIVFAGEIAANEALNRELLKSYPIIGFVCLTLVAPIIEEMIFRFELRKLVGNTKYFPLITAIVFGLPHALVGITSPLELLYVIPYGALGYVFGLLYNKTDNIIFSTMCHIIHNLMCFIIIFTLV